ncbi:MAG: UDP-glucose dehydrogenase family protein [Ferrimicrobium sp.]
MSRIAVIGAGYVGLTTAVCMAHLGHEVHCTDVVVDRIATLRSGVIPNVEEGLGELLRQGMAAGRLTFSSDNIEAVRCAEFTFLCVPTPQGDDGRADMSYIEQVATQIGPHLIPESIVVNKSTVPMGSTRIVERVLRRPDVSVVSNPEFLREGSAVHDFLHPDRIVIGADDEGTAIKVSGLFIHTSAPIVVTDPATAETIKYASNAFLATKVSFANAIAALCEAVGADVRQVILGMGYDRRIGSDFLRPGPGWGGSCFPKDTAALVRIAEDVGYDFGLLKGVITVNKEQRSRVVAKAVRMAGGSVDGKVVALWGLTFKARTDDLRDSPSLDIAQRLSAQGARVRAYDPTVRRPIDGIEICDDPYSACANAEVLVLTTEWDELRWLDFAKVGEVMASRAIMDARNLLEPAMLRRLGFKYEGIGLV